MLYILGVGLEWVKDGRPYTKSDSYIGEQQYGKMLAADDHFSHNGKGIICYCMEEKPMVNLYCSLPGKLHG